MALQLDDRWVWDSWVADDGEAYHLFYLQAPRALGDPGRRHTAATIGHARSTDLVSWEVLPDALGPRAGGWDDVALWTGSTVRGDDGVWRLYYTAISSRGYGLRDQRVGLAESDDLVTWRRVGDAPVVDIDTRWYRTIDEHETASETWRDPFVFRDPDGDGWHMLVTARARGGRRNDDGVVAHARSADMRTWEVGPPLSAPGTGFGQLEVLQVHVVDGTPVLVFTCHPQEMTQERIERSGRYCTWSLTGPSVLGPWDVDAAVPLHAEPHLFAAPLVRRRDGSWAFVGFRNTEPEGVHAFDIVDPLPVGLRDGALQVLP
ncbi:glycosyl hydrolase [Aquipuribacter nitratireducens]|uniref:Glycosyl hydrolase n=1 Tax=Aquipuribacter nitratireducens TaxID=650104 RepID=A0ABW0GRG3_9MICO